VVVIDARTPFDSSLWEYALNRQWDDVRVVSDAEVLMRAVRSGKVEVVLVSSLADSGAVFHISWPCLGSLLAGESSSSFRTSASILPRCPTKCFSIRSTQSRSSNVRRQPNVSMRVWRTRDGEESGLVVRQKSVSTVTPWPV
jgi:hypothetical protein